MIEFNLRKLEPPDEELVNFVDGIGGGAGGGDKRESERYEMTKCVPMSVVDDTCEPVGQAFMALTRNISTSGISFVHHSPIENQNIVVELSSGDESRLQVLVEIMRCKQSGEFFEIGGRYLRKLEPSS